MRTTIFALAATTALTMATPTSTPAQGPPDHAQDRREQAQERGPDRDRSQQARPPQARGQGQGQEARGRDRAQGQAGAERRGPPAHARARRGGPAPDVDRFNRNLVERAVRARADRADGDRAVRVSREDGRIRVVREDGELLFELDQETSSSLGYWRAAVVPQARDRAPARDGSQAGDRTRDRDGGIFGDGSRYPADRANEGERAGAPAFCRSGEGHPVWGRDWCIDKGFGLGDGQEAWGVDSDIEDIVLRRPSPERDVLDRGGLIDVLGDVVFGRLALQSLVLGAEEPLEGAWLRGDDGPAVLRVQAGDLPVAELVDDGRDGSVDRILLNLGG